MSISPGVVSCRHFTLEARMTEPSSAEAEAPIEDVGEGPPEENSDFSEGPVFGPDKLDAFHPHDGEGEIP